MPRIGESLRMSSFEDLLKRGKEILWSNIVKRNDIVGGEISFFDSGFYYKGTISKITLRDSTVRIMCSEVLQTDIDEDGDPVGEYTKNAWKPARDLNLPITFEAPRKKARKKEKVFSYTGAGVFTNKNWAVQNKRTGTIYFCGGSAKIIPK